MVFNLFKKNNNKSQNIPRKLLATIQGEQQNCPPNTQANLPGHLSSKQTLRGSGGVKTLPQLTGRSCHGNMGQTQEKFEERKHFLVWLRHKVQEGNLSKNSDSDNHTVIIAGINRL